MQKIDSSPSPNTRLESNKITDTLNARLLCVCYATCVWNRCQHGLHSRIDFVSMGCGKYVTRCVWHQCSTLWTNCAASAVRFGRAVKRKYAHFYLFLAVRARALLVYSLIISVILFMTGVSCMVRQEPEHGVVTQVRLAEMREINNFLFGERRERGKGRPETNKWIGCDILRTQNTNDAEKK